jgi:hydrogenase nickel incorporation protein HypB
MGEIKVIELKEEILSDNKNFAEELRTRLKASKTFMLNLMASPGAGKTSLVLNTIRELRDEFMIGVIEGDIASVVDSEKVMKEGIPVVQLKTGGFCHLDAYMIDKALSELDVKNLDLIIIENVGNLVCPAEFDTGAIKNAMILSVPEGDDKPLKYPLMFSICDVLVVNKVDFLDYSDFDMHEMKERVKSLNPEITIIDVSCKTGFNIGKWAQWLKDEIDLFQQEDALKV